MGIITSINYGKISNCESSGMISGTTTEYGGVETVAGGIAASNVAGGKIIDCISNVSVSTVSANWPYSGGITGKNSGLIVGCEAKGTLFVKKTNNAGGKVCLGGVSAYNGGTVSSSVYTGETNCSIVGINDGVVS